MLYALIGLVLAKVFAYLYVNNHLDRYDADAKEMFKMDSAAHSTPTKELLYEMKSSVDSTYPQHIDNITVIQSASVLGNDTFRYNYLIDVYRNLFY